MTEKQCFKCGRTLPLEEFYRHPQMGDGHLGKCKECTKRDVRENRERKREYYSRYDHLRQQRPERRAKQYEYGRNKRARFPAKAAAWQAVSNAIRDGRLQRQPCIYCGNEKAEAHHSDYNKPLDVIWVCFKCHRERFHGQTVTVIKEESSSCNH